MKKLSYFLIPAFAVVVVLSVVSIFIYNSQEAFASSPFGTLDSDRLDRGRESYDKNCASCHGNDAVGDNRVINSNGKRYQAPPLNGTAHAWHHSPVHLFSYVKNGSPDKLSPMLGFQDQLKDEEIQEIFAYLYNMWPDRVKRRYARFK